MNKLNRIVQKGIKILILAVFIISVFGFTEADNDNNSAKSENTENQMKNDGKAKVTAKKNINKIIQAAGEMPVYGNWETFTKEDGLPSNKVYCVKVDGDRVLAGTSGGLAVYEDGNWETYTTEDGLGHNAVVAIDVSELTGTVWLGTLGGLTSWSAGRFRTYTQLNSGLANDVIYSVDCDGKDVWTATGGGAGHLDTYTDEWDIYMERNAPMHEPWTYGVCSGDEKVYIAAWGGGIIEYNTETKQFRDYVDPDKQMELDVFPDDGLVHDITTGVSHDNGILWVATYFGVSTYDGKRWNSYFDHDSGLLSNFTNFIRAKNSVGYFCTDEGLSTFNGKKWISYQRNEDNTMGKTIVISGNKLTEGVEKSEFSSPTSISNNFVIGVDVQDDVIWIATSKGLSRGEQINKKTAGL